MSRTVIGIDVPAILPLIALALSMADGWAAEPARYFSLKMNDQVIGYSVVERDTIERDGQRLLRLKSETALKVALLGKERNTLLTSETTIRSEADEPVGYRATEKTNDVVQHVECEFADSKIRTWVYRAGEPRGEPVETEWAAGTVLLGSNNFGHWDLLLQAASRRLADGKAKVDVFVPEARQADSLELVRGQPQDVALAGATRKCVPWSLAQESLRVLADAQTGEFVLMELQAQKTRVELADATAIEIARKSRAQEILALHFADSNVVFDDFLKVTRLQAEIDVRMIGSGVDNDTGVLTTPMQEFEGRKEADRVVGTVRIHSVPYGGEDSPPAAGQGDDSEMAEWLRPSQYIESDDAAIAAKSAELTKDQATRWDAVRRIGEWVHKEISYTIADSPSARLALDKKQGDCGPHATLMVALLRAAGIPARLVGGLVYAPTFGGSFGQHAWVEVHLGKAGWIALDPTTGELGQLSATHIKLFEGMGGVLPNSVNVVAFEPPNREVTPPRPGDVKPLAWKLGKEYTFDYRRANQSLGKETLTISKVEREGKEAYELKSQVNLVINLLASLDSSATLVVANNARPFSFQRDLAAGPQKVKIECAFREGAVATDISGTTTLSREVKLPTGAYCFDDNLMGCFLLICSQLPLEPGKAVTIQTFHPSTLQIIPLTFTPQAPAPIKIGGKEIECFECEVAPINNRFWISRDGRFVRAQQGDLVIEVTELD